MVSLHTLSGRMRNSLLTLPMNKGVSAAERCKMHKVLLSDMACVCVVWCSVCPSFSYIMSKWLNSLSWFLTWKLAVVYPMLCSKQISVCPEMRLVFKWNII